MKYKIHYENKDFEDSLTIEDDTIDGIRKLANEECQIKRGWKIENCWSEKVNE